MFCVGLFGNTSRVYAGYNRGTTLTAEDVRTIFTAIGFPVPSNTRLNNYKDTLNGLINNLYSNYSDFRIENMVFYTYNNGFYCVIQNGSVGNSFDFLAINYVAGSASMARYISTYYSGDQIVGFSVDQLNNVYKITETSYNSTNDTYPTWTLTDPPMSGEGTIVYLPQVVATWNYDSVASQLSAFGVQNDTTANWRVISHTVELSGWTPDPTSTPTPTPTNTPTSSSGVVDLTDTNNKIDQVDASVQEVNENILNLTDQISGDTQQIIENLTDVPESGDFEEITSGDIINALNLPTYNDPFTSLWGELISGLSTALTCTELEYITINFLGHAYRLNVIEVDYGEDMNDMLEKIMLVLPILAVIITWRRIYLDIMSGNFMKVADYFSSFDWSQYF